jgi:hypothetical protein
MHLALHFDLQKIDGLHQITQCISHGRPRNSIAASVRIYIDFARPDAPRASPATISLKLNC